MEKGDGTVEMRDFGVDGDDGAGELEEVGEGIHKPVAADGEVAYRPTLVPSVAVAAEEHGGAGGVVEEVVFADRPTRRGEECASGAVIAHGAVAEGGGGRPGEVFGTVALLGTDGFGERFGKAHDELLRRCAAYARYGVYLRELVHGGTAYEGHGVARIAPVVAIGLPVFEAQA